MFLGISGRCTINGVEKDRTYKYPIDKLGYKTHIANININKDTTRLVDL